MLLPYRVVPGAGIEYHLHLASVPLSNIIAFKSYKLLRIAVASVDENKFDPWDKELTGGYVLDPKAVVQNNDLKFQLELDPDAAINADGLMPKNAQHKLTIELAYEGVNHVNQKNIPFWLHEQYVFSGFFVLEFRMHAPLSGQSFAMQLLFPQQELIEEVMVNWDMKFDVDVDVK